MPIPFAIRIANMMNVNSNIIAFMIKFGLPNGIPMRPIKIIETKIITTCFFGCKVSILPLLHLGIKFIKFNCYTISYKIIKRGYENLLD